MHLQESAEIMIWPKTGYSSGTPELQKKKNLHTNLDNTVVLQASLSTQLGEHL